MVQRLEKVRHLWKQMTLSHSDLFCLTFKPGCTMLALLWLFLCVGSFVSGLILCLSDDAPPSVPCLVATMTPFVATISVLLVLMGSLNGVCISCGRCIMHLAQRVCSCFVEIHANEQLHEELEGLVANLNERTFAETYLLPGRRPLDMFFSLQELEIRVKRELLYQRNVQFQTPKFLSFLPRDLISLIMDYLEP
jgi:hypothetical protein